MSFFNNLSTELLLQIFGYLPTIDLLSACLVSRRWQDSAEELLYAEASLKTSFGSVNTLHEFLPTILSRPDLARHVRALRLYWNLVRDDVPNISETRDYTAASIRFLGPDQPSDSNTLHVVLLLHLLSRLRTLIVFPPLNRTHSNPITFIDSHFHSLHSLREFTCPRVTGRAGITIKELLHILTLPSIRHVTAQMANSTSMATLNPSVFTTHYGTSPVTHLTLDYGRMCASSLAHILQLPQALKHLVYRDDPMLPARPDPVTFRLALECVRETLESLKLGWWCPALVDANRLSIGVIGPLREWPVLQKVQCTMMALLGERNAATGRLEDVLPLGVKRVHIASGYGNWRGDHIVAWVKEMVERRADGAVPWLEEVRGGTGIHLEGVIGERFRESCKAAGVSCQFRSR